MDRRINPRVTSTFHRIQAVRFFRALVQWTTARCHHLLKRFVEWIRTTPCATVTRNGEVGSRLIVIAGDRGLAISTGVGPPSFSAQALLINVSMAKEMPTLMRTAKLQTVIVGDESESGVCASCRTMFTHQFNMNLSQQIRVFDEVGAVTHGLNVSGGHGEYATIRGTVRLNDHSVRSLSA